MEGKTQAGTPLARITRSSQHPLMTIHAAAQALGYSDMTIRRRIEARQFPAVKIGSKALVPRAFVEQLIADALAGKTVVVEEYAAAWGENRGSAFPANGPDGRLDDGRGQKRVAR
jgi:excisionase family DNA binding protein